MPLKHLPACLALCLPLLAAAAPECSPSKPERFVDFLPEFSESKPFAVQRTVLPLPLLRWHSGMDTEGRTIHGPQKNYLSAGDYWRWPSLNQFLQRHDLLSNIKSQTKTTAVIDVFRDGEGGMVTFRFKTVKGCWFLWQYEVKEA